MMNAMLPILAAGDPMNAVVSHKLVGVGPIQVSNHLMMGVVSAVVVFVLFSKLAKKMSGSKEAPEDYVVKGTFSQLLETMCCFVRDNVARPNLGHLTDKYIGYLWSVFFFILTCNLLGMVPTKPLFGLIASILGVDYYTNGWMYYLGGTATGTIALTIPLALTAFFMINYVGIKEAGVDYFKHFNPGPVFMAPLLVPLEVMGLVIKSSVLAMRLFGTMMAGHLVIAAFIGLIAMAGGSLLVGLGVMVMGAALMALELFIALLQAFIFTFLTTLFIASGAVHHHDDHDDAHGHETHGQTHPEAAAA